MNRRRTYGPATLLLAATAAWSILPTAQATDMAVVDAALKSAERPKSDLEQDERRKARDVLAFAGVGPGMHVVDMFSAGGYYTELLSKIVGPKGGVVAYNNPEYAKFADKEIAARYAADRLPNVKQVTVPIEALSLDPGSLDVVLFIMSYHDIYWRPADGSWPVTDGKQVLGKLLPALKPGGVVIVQDHVDKAGADPLVNVDKIHRIDPAVVRRDFEQAGFVLDGESKVLAHPDDDHTKLVYDDVIRGKTDQFIYMFRKPR